MKKKDLLKQLDTDTINRLYSFCYRRTSHSADADDLCSDILLALVKAADREGEIANPTAFIMGVARKVYADFSERRRLDREYTAPEPEDGFVLAEEDPDPFDDEDEERLSMIYREIAFLSEAYRRVMILFYLEGKSTAEIAAILHIKETTVRQRLFSARNIIKDEVTKMEQNNTKKTSAATPLSLRELDLVIWGNGNPLDGDPRDVAQRQLSKHIIWFCRDKARTIAEISDALNIPMLYAEEEVNIQVNGTNGRYGMLKRLPNGKYITNCILLDKDEVQAATDIYERFIPMVCDAVEVYIREHREDYLSFPYRNHKVDLNLILWTQIRALSDVLGSLVRDTLKQNYLSDVIPSERPFSIYGYEYFGRDFGGGWDGIEVNEYAGRAYVKAENLYMNPLRPHFHCGHDWAHDEQLRMTVRAIDGLAVSSLSETEKEIAAKAIECGYLLREGDTLYTKVLVMDKESRERLFETSFGIRDAFFEAADTIAKALAPKIRSLPAHLLGDWRFYNDLADMPLLDALVEEMIARGHLTPPENGLGAEGCWLTVE